MSLTHQEKQIASDLQTQCARSCANASRGVVELCDNAPQATFVAAGGVVGAAGTLLVLMSDDDMLLSMAGAEQHDLSLLAMIFAWWTDLKDRDRCGTKTIEDGLPWMVSHWEKMTGKTFDPDWLYKPLADILREAKSRAA